MSKAVLIGIVVFGCVLKTAYSEPVSQKKMIILGIDGFDPDLLEKYLEEGKMPNVKNLLEKGGSFRKLTTSNPPQSPVAWSCVATGTNPGKHGIFDFIHRHPQNMNPYLSISEVEKSKSISFGAWQFPLGSVSVRNLRKGKTFWEYLCDNNIPVTVAQIPANYPPHCSCQEDSYKSLSGMGTPDLLGTQGTSSFYTDEPVKLKETIGGVEVYPVEVKNGKVESFIFGPLNPHSNPAYFKDPEQIRLKMPLTIWVDKTNSVAKIKVSGQEVLLNEGEFSCWLPISFSGVPFLHNIKGICRFYLKECHPHFKLYMSPINIDPSNPVLTISSPETYSKELFKNLGYFYTQNMPTDTKALQHQIFSDEEFLKQTNIVFEEEKRRLEYELNHFQNGLLFHYFCVIDQVSHVFWRAIDLEHPLYSEELHSKYGRVIEDLYRQMDEVIGNVSKFAGDDTLILIISDHGFASFRRQVGLNTLLYKAGLLAKLKSSKEEEFLSDVNWASTQAYQIGINSVYINLYGREANGIVFQPDYNKVCDEIEKLFLNLIDSKTGIHPIKKVFRRNQIYKGSYTLDAPDLVVGFEKGYRASWNTMIGKTEASVISDNMNVWSGDHTIDYELVPGVLLVNRKISPNHDPNLIDIAPTILDYFKLQDDPDLEGESFLN